MRTIKFIAIHCTGTHPEATVDAITNYWKNVKKWKSPGYHYIYDRYGNETKLLGEEHISNGVKGFNHETINLSYIGGKDHKGNYVDTRTEAQKEAMLNRIKDLHARYPKAIIKGHRDFPNVKKACPAFDVKTWLNEVKIN